MNQPNHVISENLVISQPLYDNDLAAQSIYDKYLKDCSLIPINLIEESKETQERPFAGTRQNSQQQQNQRNDQYNQEIINKLKLFLLQYFRKRIKKQKSITNLISQLLVGSLISIILKQSNETSSLKYLLSSEIIQLIIKLSLRSISLQLIQKELIKQQNGIRILWSLNEEVRIRKKEDASITKVWIRLKRNCSFE